MKLKKILGTLLAVVCTMNVFSVTQPLTANAETYGDYLSYQKIDEDDNGTYDYVEISDCDISAVSVKIPSEIDGLPVTSIGYRAFNNCISLKSITIPNSVTSIGFAAFKYCESLTSITIPDSVTSIGMLAFDYCKSLEKVNITDITAWCNINFDEYYSNPLYYAENLYLNDELVTDLIIPNSITNIGACAFSGCTSLESITIPDSVTSIGNRGFSGCTSLESITIPDSVTSIGNCAFDYCTSLESVIIPDSITSISSSAFSACTNLKSITIPNSVTSIGHSAFFVCTNLESVTIPNSVTSIDDSAFESCTSLTSITIENPECEICDKEYTIFSGLDENGNAYFNGTIYGLENSTAQAYAEKYGYKFAIIGEEYVALHGDISYNGIIDLYDAIEIAKSLIGARTFTDEEKKIADFNNDGIVDLYDAISIAKKMLEK